MSSSSTTRLNANDAYSETRRNHANTWAISAAMSRLERQSKGTIIVAMQRLHAQDMTGFLEERGGWRKIAIPAICTKTKRYRLDHQQTHTWKKGAVIQPNRESLAAIEKIREEFGSAVFAAQYQQDPSPADGNMVRREWIKRYTTALSRSAYSQIVMAMDCAGKPGEQNDFTAIVIAGVAGRTLHVLEAHRGHWTVVQMRQMVQDLHTRWSFGTLLIEDTAAGTALLQLLREVRPILNVRPCLPKGRQAHPAQPEPGSIRIRHGAVPHPMPPGSPISRRKILAFPNGRYDDQLDALLHLLEWFGRQPAPIIGVPPIIAWGPKPQPGYY